MAKSKKSDKKSESKDISSSSVPIKVNSKKTVEGPKIISHKSPTVIKPIDMDSKPEKKTDSNDGEVDEGVAISEIGKPKPKKAKETTAADFTFADGHINIPGIPNVEDEGSQEKIVDISKSKPDENRTTEQPEKPTADTAQEAPADATDKKPAQSVISDKDEKAEPSEQKSKEVSEENEQEQSSKKPISPTTMSHKGKQISPLLNEEAQEHLASTTNDATSEDNPEDDAETLEPNESTVEDKLGAIATQPAANNPSAKPVSVASKAKASSTSTTPAKKVEQKPKQVKLNGNYKVAVGGKGKKSKQLQRKHSAFKINKKLLLLLLLVLLIGGIWAFLYFWYPKMALGGFYQRVITADSLEFETSLKLLQDDQNSQTTTLLDHQASGKYEQSDGKVEASETSRDSAQPEIFADQSHYRANEAKVYEPYEAVDLSKKFDNQCGAHELPSLLQTFFAEASESMPSVTLRPVGALLESRDGTWALHYNGVADNEAVTQAFKTALAEYETTCASQLSNEQSEAISSLLSSEELTIDYWYGWKYDEISISSSEQNADNRLELTLDLIVKNYNKPAGIDPPLLPTATTGDGETSEDEPADCDAACRDKERREDLVAIEQLVEEYGLANDGAVPTASQLEEFAGKKSSQTLVDPSGNKINTGKEFGYTYTVNPENCDNQSVVCLSYEISVELEVTDETLTLAGPAGAEEENPDATE